MAKMTLYVLGVVFLAIGVLGFFNDPILGIFAVDAIHNIVHLASGLILLGLAYAGTEQARMGAKVFGIVYGLIAVLGFVLPGEMLLGLLEVNLADDVLHAVIAVVLLYVGFAGSNGAPAMQQQQAAGPKDQTGPTNMPQQ